MNDDQKMNILTFLGIPEQVGILILTLSLILLISPYFSNTDFGIFKIPIFPEKTQKRLKIFGPIIFLVSNLMFFPFIEKPHKCNGERQFTVTIQYPSSEQKPNVQALQQELSGEGFFTPGYEKVNKNAIDAPKGQAVIKYFHDDDFQAAKCLKKVVSQKVIANAQIEHLPELKSEYQHGTIEVWYPK